MGKVQCASSGPPIQVVGMGMSAGMLSSSAQAALASAELLIGSPTHLDAFPELTAEKVPYPSPMSGLRAMLHAGAGRRIVLLASGDPLFYGISQTLLRWLPPEQLVFHPNVSSLQAAFARLGRPWDQAQCVSLHGRPLAGLRAVLRANRLYALLTDRDSSPPIIAQRLVETGLGESTIWVAEDLGTAGEQFRRFQAADLADASAPVPPRDVEGLGAGRRGGRLTE